MLWRLLFALWIVGLLAAILSAVASVFNRMRSEIQSAMAFAAPPPRNMTATEIVCRTLQARERVVTEAESRAFGDMLQHLYNLAGRSLYPASGEAEQRSMELLRSRLSAVQLADFEKSQSFEVVGSDTGRRYRITTGTVGNVLDLDEGSRLCFAPAGGLSVGDVMLAQKIALETREHKALLVANRGGLIGDVFYPGQILYVDHR